MAAISNVTLANTNAGVTLTIYTTRVKTNFTNALTLIKAPTARPSQEAGPKETKILNLMRYEMRFTITGEIAAADYSTAIQLCVAKGNHTLTYADLPNISKAPFTSAGSVLVMIDKCDIDRSEKETDEDTNKPATLPIVITLVAGAELGAS